MNLVIIFGGMSHVLFGEPDYLMRAYPSRIRSVRPGTANADRLAVPSGFPAYLKNYSLGQPIPPPKTYPYPEWPGGVAGWDAVRPKDVPLGYSVWQWLDARERNDLPDGPAMPRRFRNH